MALNDFEYSPSTGWNDVDVFPDYPARDQVRPLMQRLFDQIKTYLGLVKTEVNTHTAETVSYGLSITRDVSITGVQVVTLPFKAKRIDCTYVVNNTLNQGKGCYAENGYQRAIFYYATSGVYAIDTGFVVLGSDSSNRAIGTVQNITDTGFEINWTKVGTPTGTVAVAISALTHGEG